MRGVFSYMMHILKALQPVNLFNKFTKIRNKIFSLNVFLMLAFGIMGIFMFQFLSSIYEDMIYEESADKLQLSVNVLDRELSNIEYFSYQIVTDPNMQNYMDRLNTASLNYDFFRSRTNTVERMTLFANQERYIKSIEVVDANQHIMTAGLSPGVEINMEETTELIHLAGGGNVWKGAEEDQVIVAAREFKKQENLSLEHLGYLFVYIDLSDLIKEAMNFAADNHFVITNGDGVLYSNQYRQDQLHFLSGENPIEEYDIIEVENEEYFVISQPSQFYDLVYYNMILFEDINNQKAMISLMMGGYVLAVVIITVFISRRYARAISRPIEELTQKSKSVQNGHFDQLFNGENSYLKDEIGDLQKNFYIMIDKINVLIKENYEKNLVIKETEYKALQSQINPHFFYNTLDSINWMAKVNRQNKISEMAEALGQMMRSILSKKDPLIRLKEELEIVESYITIQKYRYGERLHFKLETDAGLEEASIPKLTIQPVIENAIRHGLEEMIDVCRISVKIIRSRDDYIIMVHDNGPGIEPDTIEKIYQGNIKPKGTGIGLYNINERIRLMFSEDYGVRIESMPGYGTTLTITLPVYLKE